MRGNPRVEKRGAGGHFSPESVVPGPVDGKREPSPPGDADGYLCSRASALGKIRCRAERDGDTWRVWKARKREGSRRLGSP